MADQTPALRELARTYGIATEFWDWQGRHVEIAPTTIAAALAALGIDASTPQAAQASVEQRRVEHWTRMLPPCRVIREGRAEKVWVHVPHGSRVDVWVELETGARRVEAGQVDDWTDPQEIEGVLVGQASFAVPSDLPLGYHTVHAAGGGRTASMPLIVTPNWVGLPARMTEQRAWGLATQLYSVRSAGSWGLGDLADLTDLAVWSAAEQGAGFVLVNPLHAAEPVPRMEPSPYLPTSRRFANPVYLRVERIPEFADLDETARVCVEALRAAWHDGPGRAPDETDRIDRDAVWAAKREALLLVHAAGRSAGRQIAYEAFRRREGQGLEDYATWCALAEIHGTDWHAWPEELRSPASPDVERFRADAAHAVDFHRWLQWVLDEQLAQAQAESLRNGMSLGVMHDLAVGVHPTGADSWRLQDVFAQGITVGAPPDAYNQNGQDWGQPPWRPDRLAELGYEPFREMLATVLRNAGGLRADHILGLFRLWWVPAGHKPTDGTYVIYDHEAMVGILALEAVRAQAVVVGEDVGTVEPWVREYLAERGILGTSILWFEFDYTGTGLPLPPPRWREYCLASVTTHDLPPTAGFLAGDHVRLRDSLGLLTRSLADELAAARGDREAWMEALRRHEVLPEGATGTDDADVETVVQALHRYLTRTPARLLCVALPDAVGDRRTQNQPGTIDEYPNWRVPLSGPDGVPLALEDVFTSRRAAALAAVIRGEDDDGEDDRERA